MKPFYTSKTFWLNILGALAIAVPATNAVIQQHFTEAGMGWLLLNTVLRFVSKDKLSLS
jgi:hypothetical protein